MVEFLLTFAILLAVVAMMSIGVMRGRAPIAGTCGGLNNMGLEGECEICGGDTNKCESSAAEGIVPERMATQGETSAKKADYYSAS